MGGIFLGMESNEVRIGQTVVDHNRRDWIAEVKQVNVDGEGRTYVFLEDLNGRTGFAYPANIDPTDKVMKVRVTATQRAALYTLLEHPGFGVSTMRMYNTLLAKGLIENTSKDGIVLTEAGRAIFA